MKKNRDSVIEIHELTKVYRDQVVLDHVSLKLNAGKIYGIIGRNGSGKTMLLRHICGFVYPTEGYVAINGRQLQKDRKRNHSIGAIIETPGFLNQYSGYKNLRILAMIQNRIGEKEIREALRTVGLDPDLKKTVGKYSLGMRQRLGIAQAIMENPDILLLDEPMNGLDEDGIEDMRRLFLELRAQGKLIILATHSMEDISLLCDEVYRLRKGKLVGME